MMLLLCHILALHVKPALTAPLRALRFGKPFSCPNSTWLLFPFSQRPVSSITCFLHKFTNGCLSSLLHCMHCGLGNFSRFPTSTTGCCFPFPSAH